VALLRIYGNSVLKRSTASIPVTADRIYRVQSEDHRTNSSKEEENEREKRRKKEKNFLAFNRPVAGEYAPGVSESTGSRIYKLAYQHNPRELLCQGALDAYRPTDRHEGKAFSNVHNTNQVTEGASATRPYLG
jgi:hypothetical protein